MIEIIEGFGVGAGKSYFCATRLIEHFIVGGTAFVVDSFDLLWPKLKEYIEKEHGLLLQDCQYQRLSEEQILRVHEHTPPGTEECPVLIVIDECHGALNARDWNDKSKRDLFDWCTQSRHDDNDLIFISQSAANIDKQLRRIATYNWRIRNSERMGEGNILRTALRVWQWLSFGLHGGPCFILNQLDQDGRTPLGKKRFIQQDKKIFGIYRSKSMRGKRKRAGDAIARIKLERAKRKAPSMIKYLVIGVIATVGFCGWKLARTDWSFGHKSQTPAAVVKTGSSDKPAVTPSAAPAYEVIHEPWRGKGAGWMHTDACMYRAGKMSVHGYCASVDDSTALVYKPDGGILYVLGDDVIVPVARLAQPVSAPTPPKILGIADEGPFARSHNLNSTPSR